MSMILPQCFTKLFITSRTSIGSVCNLEILFQHTISGHNDHLNHFQNT